VWRLTKGGHVAVCTLRSHPKGGEAIIVLDGELYRSEAGADGTALFHLSFDWKQQFEGKGWT